MAVLPSGLDRADGLLGRPGTPTPAALIKANSYGRKSGIANVPTEEFPDSPEIERAEQATFTHRYRMSWNNALTHLATIGRGKIETDSYGNVTKVLSCSVKRVNPGVAELTKVSEAVSFDAPPDQFQITPVELGVNIIKHPRYFYAFLGTGQGSATEQKNQMVIRLLQDYFANTSAAYRDALIRLLKCSYNHEGNATDTKPDWKNGAWTPNIKVAGTNEAKAAAVEIIMKWWRGEETPYIIGYQMVWAAYYFRPQPLNPGGYVESPLLATPQLPEYFYAVDLAGIGVYTNTIFDLIAAYNPQCYSSTGKKMGDPNISWLRKADEIEYERTWFKVVRTWLGAPVGHWDEQLFNQYDRPSTAAHYMQVATPGGVACPTA